MFLKKLLIKKKNTIIREIKFHKGLNLIIDETNTNNRIESGNNVGKTTVIRLIDYCFGGDGKNLYCDPEFPEKSNTAIKSFLVNENVTISLILKDDLNDETSREIEIKRNFLKYKQKIQEINGESYANNNEFNLKLKELLFSSPTNKPSIRQIVAKNIRDEKFKLSNTVKVLHYNSTKEEYEALYLFWFGISSDDAVQKQKLYESKKTEEKVIRKIKKENSESEIKQALIVIERDISDLNELKNKFAINYDFENDISKLNDIKLQINVISTKIGRLKIRKDLIVESKNALENEQSNIDMTQLKDIYKMAKFYIPNLHSDFNKLVEFHNNMITKKIKFIAEELPSLNNIIDLQYDKLRLLIKHENELSEQLKKHNLLSELEHIIHKLNMKYELKGKYEELLRQWNESVENLSKIELELKILNSGIDTHQELLNNRIKEFNVFFTKFSEKLYKEQFILSYYKDERAYALKISNIEGNVGTGKKKAQIAAFDLAYIKFCDKIDIPCLHFILHDQFENIHDNQLNTLSDVVNETSCQLVVPVLKDKLPPEFDIKKFTILTLSQNDKLFKI